MGTRAQVDGGYGFATVAAVLADPFPPGLDPATLRLPSVPRLRSDEDDADHHREYWRAHVWAVLHRYRAAYADPACPPWLRADHDRVADEGRRLIGRATATHPISPIDSVACHAALKDLTAGATALERTVVALGGTTGVAPAGRPTAAVPVPDIGDRPGPDDQPGPDERMAGQAVADRTPAGGVHGQDFFAPSARARDTEPKVSLRGARGLRRSRALTGHPTADRPTD